MLQFDGESPFLTSREREVLKLVAGGCSAKQVAQQIGVAPRTAERHIENCRHKLRARNRTHMIAKAIACGELKVAADPEDRPLFFADSSVSVAC